jgi:hypothetical protein
MGLIWDTGAKFIFVVRDEGLESGILLCLFCVNKGEETLELSPYIDTRMVKGGSSHLKVGFDPRSSFLTMIDLSSCNLRIISLE